MPPRVTLVMEGTGPDAHVRLADFISELEALRGALRKTEQILAGTALVDWRVVELSHRSPATIIVEGSDTLVSQQTAQRADQVAHKFVSYISELSLSEVAPAELDRSTLESFKELAAPVRQSRIRAWVSNGGVPVEVAKHLDTLVTETLGPEVHAAGSVKGDLEFINVHGERNVFRIYPSIGANRVVCYFRDDQLERARGAIGRKVRVFGQVTYLARDPFPSRVQVERIDVLADDSALPSFLDLKGIAPQATGQLSSEDFVRLVRSEG